MNELNCKRLNAIKCEIVLSRSWHSSNPTIHGKATHSTVTHSSNGCLPLISVEENALSVFLDGCRRRQMAVKLAPNGHNAHSITVELQLQLCAPPRVPMAWSSGGGKGSQATEKKQQRACNQLQICQRPESIARVTVTSYLLLATCSHGPLFMLKRIFVLQLRFGFCRRL